MSALDYLMKELYEKVGQGLTPEEVIASWYGVEPSSLFRGMSPEKEDISSMIGRERPVTPEEDRAYRLGGNILTAKEIAKSRFSSGIEELRSLFRPAPETPKKEPTASDELKQHLCEHGDWKEICILCRDDD